ncbi:MAG: hypothetical protein JJU45_16705 [Acidimicrobiia bacterium]|nr:hypothetical protein [Acidimicrobiia bacterium]
MARDPAGDENVVTSDDTPNDGGRLVYGLTAESDGWNPTLSRWSPSAMQVAQAIFDPLTVVDDSGGWQPFLAESLESTDDHMEWTIALRDGVRFHDGRPFDAEALAGQLRFIMESPLTELTLEPVESVEVVGDDVVLTMRQPFATLPYSFSSQIGFVVDPAWLASHGPDEVPNTTGPFVPVSWEKDRRLIAERNDDYWRPGLPHLSEIEFQPIPDEAERSRSLRQGELSLAQFTDPPALAEWRRLAADGDTYQYIDSDGSETSEHFIMLNLSQPPFDDPEARLALALATDRERFLTQIGGDEVFEIANSPWAPSSPWHTDVDFPDHDPDRAADLVEQVVDRHGEFSFTLSTTPTPGSQRATNALIEAWQEAGIDVTLDTRSQADLIVDVLFNSYQAASWRQFDYPHPSNEVVWWNPRTSGGEHYPFEYDTPEPPVFALNFARIRDQRLEELVDAVVATAEESEQRRLFGEIAERLNDELPYIWLYHTRDAVVARSNVVNVAEWTTPNGTPGVRFNQGAHPVAQIWLRN